MLTRYHVPDLRRRYQSLKKPSCIPLAHHDARHQVLNTADIVFFSAAAGQDHLGADGRNIQQHRQVFRPLRVTADAAEQLTILVDPRFVHLGHQFGGVRVTAGKIAHRQLHLQPAHVAGCIGEQQFEDLAQFGFHVPALGLPILQFVQAAVAPAIQEADHQILMVLEMPVETAPCHAELLGQRQHP